ncbi:MAG: hypothetical protein HQL25_07670 [Candidatus Omnitrophica bacterium]|nr:hypothetical protein [Candidatus Omnitrophota bacterium]
MKLLRIFLMAFFISLTFARIGFCAYPDTDKPICAVYLSGIGCHNCAQTDPVIFFEWTQKFPNLLVFEYEVFKHELDNLLIKNDYYKSYSEEGQTGVPFIILGEKVAAMGRINVKQFVSTIGFVSSNPFPLQGGGSVEFKDLDLNKLTGKFNIWTKNRVLIAGHNAPLKDLQTILLSGDIQKALKSIEHKKVAPESIEISGAQVDFTHAVLIGDWRVQWNDLEAGNTIVGKLTTTEGKLSVKKIKPKTDSSWIIFLLLLSLVFVFVPVLFFKERKVAKGAVHKVNWKTRIRDIIIAILSSGGVIAFIVFAKQVSPDFLQQSGYSMPLPLFTFLIALVDSFNPCNMFALTGMLALLVATSASRARLYIVGLTFVVVVYIFYYLFMAAWLNVFNYLSFVKPLRIGIAVFSLIAGLINCKELFFFRKGVSLMVQDEHKGLIKTRMEKLKEVVQKGSLPMLLSSSVALAVLTSLVEIPCTAGFPIIYTQVLIGHGLGKGFGYYSYLAFYNLIYVVPLLMIVGVFIITFRGRQLTQRHMEIMKYVSGLIMIVLGIILLINPALVGVGGK